VKGYRTFIVSDGGISFNIILPLSIVLNKLLQCVALAFLSWQPVSLQ
jgi:hypothetical protein